MDLLHANDRPGEFPPSWYAATAVAAPRRPALAGDRRADVCIVGAGYTGLSAALHLARAGLSVVVLEAHRAGWGASGRNGGQVGSGQRVDQGWIEARLPGDARALWDMAEAAKALVHDLGADMPGVDWRPGIAHALRKPAEVAEARRYADRLARVYGYDRITPLDRDALAALLGSEAYAGGELDEGAGHIHPLNFALGLAAAAEAAGAVILERSAVLSVGDGAPVHLRTAGGCVTADHVILACNGYLGGLEPAVAARVMPINNFIIATEPLGDLAPMTRPVAVADSRFVVNYWRQTPDGRMLFGGGESYGYRFPDIAATVRKPMLQVYPQLAGARVGLHGEHRVAIGKRRVGAERIGGQRPRAGRRGGHLVLMPGIQAQGRAVKVIVLRADGPAAGKFFHLAPQRLGDDLVAKADAHHRHAVRLGAADEILQRGDERVILINAVPRPGDDPAIAILRAGGKFHVHHGVIAKVESLAGKQAAEHVRVGARLRHKRFGGVAGLQNADAHDALWCVAAPA